MNQITSGAQKAIALLLAVSSFAIKKIGVHETITLIVAAAGVGLILVFGLVAEEVMEGETHRIDTAILMSFRSNADPAIYVGPPWLPEVMRDLTALGSYAFLIIIVSSVFGYLTLLRKYLLSIVMIAAVAGGVLISNLLKHGFDRPRPELENIPQVFSPSFPSGHATLSAVTFLTLAGLLTRVGLDWRVKLYFLALAGSLTVIVGVSRVYLGVHYPSDVVAGWCIGTAWALLCWAAAFWLQRHGKVESSSAE